MTVLQMWQPQADHRHGKHEKFPLNLPIQTKYDLLEEKQWVPFIILVLVVGEQCKKDSIGRKSASHWVFKPSVTGIHFQTSFGRALTQDCLL